LGLADINFFSKKDEPGMWWSGEGTTASNSFSIVGHGGLGYVIDSRKLTIWGRYNVNNRLC